jgi:hypothetical protein
LDLANLGNERARMRPTARGILSAILVSGAFTGGASAQTTYPNVKVTGRLQEQSYYFGNEAYAAQVGPQSNIFTRRARIEARGHISENVSVYIQPSFEGGRNLSSLHTTCTSSEVPAGGGTPTITCQTTGRSGLRLRDAYIDVRFSKEPSQSALYLRAGQEKRPYSRYELTSSTNLPSIERGAGPGMPGAASKDHLGAAGVLWRRGGGRGRVGHQRGETRLGTG